MSTQMPKVARRFSVPIVMSPEREDALVLAREALDVKSESLLASAAARIRAARARAVPVDGQTTADAESRAGDTVVEGDVAELRVLSEAVQAAQVALSEVTETFTFRSLGRKAWCELVAKHPPGEQDNAAWTLVGGQGDAPWSTEGLRRDLLHLASESPVLSTSDVAGIVDGDVWSEPEVDLLFAAAILAQSQIPNQVH